jgi:flagellin-like hook-associated protein FlgL
VTLSIRTNSPASSAAGDLSRADLNLQKSQERLSSGARINASSEDAGGLAVSVRLAAALLRGEATSANIANAISLLQAQDGVLQAAESAVFRMAELATQARDVTKNSGQIAGYDAEFQKLQEQLVQLSSERFNGIALFRPPASGAVASATTAGALTVSLSEDGGQTGEISLPALGINPWMDMVIHGFVSFADPARPTRRIFVPNRPQDEEGYLETGESFDLDQTTTVTQRWRDTFTLPPGHLWRGASIPAHSYTATVGGNPVVQAAATAVTVPVSIGFPASPPLRSLGQDQYELQPPTRSPYVTTPTYRELAENLRTGNYIDPLHAGTTVTGSITVQYAPPGFYNRGEDGSTTSTIVLTQASDTVPLTSTLEPWSGNDLSASAANVSDSVLRAGSSAEFGGVLKRALDSLAKIRAQNGAEQSRLTYAAEVLATQQFNLQEANRRMVDVDVAGESGRLARLKVLQQAASAMLAQANLSPELILKLLR